MKKNAQILIRRKVRSVHCLLIAFCALFASCKTTGTILQQANTLLISDTNISKGFIGISVFDPASNTYVYNYNADKYFVPASNTKLFTLYAGMKYLGDSLAGLRYEINNGQLNIIGTGDPTFLHPDFKTQPVFAFLKRWTQVNYVLFNQTARFGSFGRGWPLDDYPGDYSAERSEFPVYGNVATFLLQGDTVSVNPPRFFNQSFAWQNGTLRNGAGAWFDIVRPFEENSFHSLSNSSRYVNKSPFTAQSVPFKTITGNPGILRNKTFIKLLEDTLHTSIGNWSYFHQMPALSNTIYSQPTDSLLKPMMHRSDNFFAEQTLLMASNEHLGYMSDDAIIDTLLKTALADIPQKPNWVDGSGLSRYNLFTPQDFVYILNKMKNEFGMQRMKNILATGGEGTIKNYFLNDAGFIYAKTGTLSNNCALSGYMITKQNRLLIFSVLANNYQTGATPIRRAVEKFVQYIRNTY